MTLMDAGSFAKMEVITMDAHVLGEVQDLRYDPISWEIKGFKVKSSKSAASVLSAGSGRSMMFLETGDYAVNDVVLVDSDLEGLRGSVSADSDASPTLSYLKGKKVVSSDGIVLGTLDEVVVDAERWVVPTFKMKLDKAAYEHLGVKRGLFAKTVSGIPASDIASVSETVSLYPTAAELRSSIVIE
ncbi:MAG: hypothetical protein GX224_04175 [Thermoplasmatales archaeon]|nr:hypothetical protein [Thermoplasmatales archaeon]